MKAKLTDKSSIKSVVENMTLEEKLNLVGEYTACRTFSMPNMEIPSLLLADGATGVNGTQMILDYITAPGMNAEALQQRFYTSSDFKNLLTEDLTQAQIVFASDEIMLGLIEYMKKVRANGKQFISFPAGINIGASFSEETAMCIGEAVGWELRDSGIDLCMGPNVDIARDPLGGRNYEMYGEDPKLVADIGTAYIQGMQKTGVGACAKHFIANNQETDRNSSNACISERTLRELYAKGFESAVKKAKVKSVMTAYSAVNGVFSSYNKVLLTDLLRKEWGFEGIVVSDWGAVATEKEKSLEAGMDLILCGPNDMSECKKAISQGRMSLDILDERVRAILNVIVELKEEQEKTPHAYDTKKLLTCAYDTIVDGSVLLKNADELLPLKKATKIAVYGSRSKNMVECGSGSTNVTTNLHSNLFDECRSYSSHICFERMDAAEVLIYTASAPAGENMDREAMDIEPEDRKWLPVVLKEAKERGLKTVVVLNIAGPVDLRSWIEYADSILCIFIPGCMGGKAVADLLFGVQAPAGKLPVTFPLRYEDTPAFPNYPSEQVTCFYGEEIFVGYRSYDKKNLKVQFPFGFGLSYTNFVCKMKSCAYLFDLTQEDKIQVVVTVQNSGERYGSEVVQIYGMEKVPHGRRAVKELYGFRKIFLRPGEKKDIYIPIEKEILRIFDTKKKRWVIPVGEYQLYAGTSSRDIFAETTLHVKGENPFALGADSTIGEIMEIPEAMDIINQFTEGLFHQIDEENLKFMVSMKLSDVLSSAMIAVIPDSAKVKEILAVLYEKLAALI